jgi:hypothetical protein
MNEVLDRDGTSYTHRFRYDVRRSLLTLANEISYRKEIQKGNGHLAVTLAFPRVWLKYLASLPAYALSMESNESRPKR